MEFKTTTTTKSTTVTTTTTLFSNLTNIIGPLNNVSSAQVNEILQNGVGSITGCLLNCSNQGSCSYDPLTKQISCVCNQYFTGSSCQTDTRPCSSNPCLNSGNCTNHLSSNSSLFKCECDSYHTGIYCENQIDLCLNSTCVPNQGYCKVTGSTTSTCVCLYGYEGVNCDQKSESLQTQKTIVSIASVLAFIILGLFWCLIFFMDYLKFFVMKSSLSQTYKLKKQKSKKFVYHNDETFRKEMILENCLSSNDLIKESHKNYLDKIEDGLKKFNEIKKSWLKD